MLAAAILFCRRIIRIELILASARFTVGEFNEFFGCHTSNS